VRVRTEPTLEDTAGLVYNWQSTTERRDSEACSFEKEGVRVGNGEYEQFGFSLFKIVIG
jgi:hypothetical protein